MFVLVYQIPGINPPTVGDNAKVKTQHICFTIPHPLPGGGGGGEGTNDWCKMTLCIFNKYHNFMQWLQSFGEESQLTVSNQTAQSELGLFCLHMLFLSQLSDSDIQRFNHTFSAIHDN